MFAGLLISIFLPQIENNEIRSHLIVRHLTNVLKKREAFKRLLIYESL